MPAVSSIFANETGVNALLYANETDVNVLLYASVPQSVEGAA